MEVTAIKSCFSRPEPALGNEQWNPHFHDNNAVKLSAATVLRALNNKKQCKVLDCRAVSPGLHQRRGSKAQHGDFSGTGGASKRRTRWIPVKSLFKNGAAWAAPSAGCPGPRCWQHFPIPPHTHWPLSTVHPLTSPGTQGQQQHLCSWAPLCRTQCPLCISHSNSGYTDKALHETRN